MASKHKMARPSTHKDSKLLNSDLVAEILNRDIESFRLESFHNFGINIFIYPASDAEPIIDSRGKWLGFQEYYFDIFSEPPKRMQVRLVTDSSTYAVQIRFMKHWVPVSHYLKQHKPAIDWDHRTGFSALEISQRQYEQQARWWAANGMKFQLLELPVEIREIICGFAIGPVVEPYPTNKARRLGQHTAAILARQPNFNLLKTCRLVYKEASDILFGHTPFWIEHLGVMRRLAGGTVQLGRIRRLELALSHYEFFKLFSSDIMSESRASDSNSARTLRTMQLTHLKFLIAPPSDTTEHERLDSACQKIVVDSIFRAALPFVMGHPVRITGFVKTRQKQDFEAACRAGRKRYMQWQSQRLAIGDNEGTLAAYDEWIEQHDDGEEGGVLLDEEARKAVEQIEDEGDKDERVENGYFNPICACRVRCRAEGWTAEN